MLSECHSVAAGCPPRSMLPPSSPPARLHSLASLDIGCGCGTGCHSQKGNGNDCFLRPRPPCPPPRAWVLAHRQKVAPPNSLPPSHWLHQDVAAGPSRTASSVLSRSVTWEESGFSPATMRTQQVTVSLSFSTFRGLFVAATQPCPC